METPSPFLEMLGILEYGGIPNVTEPNCLFDWGSAKIIHRTSVQLNLTSKPYKKIKSESRSLDLKKGSLYFLSVPNPLGVFSTYQVGDQSDDGG